MQIFFNILIMIVILGVEISIHEAGHLSMAKLFKVYCFEYSIGFGPKLLHVKRKNGETYFSLRALPFGGYVTMYAEKGEVPDGMVAPPENRSLAGVKRWKKAIIMAAGIVLNYLLGMILIFVSLSCFPQYYSGYGGTFSQSYGTEQTASITAVFGPGTYSEDGDVYSKLAAATTAEDVTPNDYFIYFGTSEYPSGSQYGYIVDSEVYVTDKDGKTVSDNAGDPVQFVAVYTASTLTSAHTFTKNIYLYQVDEVTPDEYCATLAPDDEQQQAALKQIYADHGITAFPAVSKEYSNGKAYFDPSSKEDSYYSYSLDLKFLLMGNTFNEAYDSGVNISEKITIKDGAWTDPGVTADVVSQYNGWNKAWEDWAVAVPYYTVAIVKGIAGLFTPSGWSSLSGVVGMTAAVGQVSAMGGAASIFMYAGMISLNLALFNLLPFPGLDGWHLLVTAIEGATNSVKRRKWKKAHPMDETIPEGSEKPVYKEWRIPSKVNGIISFIGLGLLVALMIALMIKDIIGLI